MFICFLSYSILKLTPESAVVRCISGDKEAENRDLVKVKFVEWGGNNHSTLNLTKRKEMVVNFRRKRCFLVTNIISNDPCLLLVSLICIRQKQTTVVSNVLTWCKNKHISIFPISYCETNTSYDVEKIQRE